ncbi:arsenic resistance N-acetyltransferase ArsN2 [Niveibacterium terrae]|uniref:arsenic resistance N-acetyltransferase ArsN2 n=1 Tax=Niveibacterium terrae TaxID=3373598 RepID=UPI003A8FAB12
MSLPCSTGERLRELVRQYVRIQRVQNSCCDDASTVQCHILNELLRHEILSQRALADQLGLDKGWISRAVAALVDEGVIDKAQDGQDKRSVALRLTESGRARARALNAKLNLHAEGVLAALSGDRLETVHDALGWLLEALADSASTPVARCGCASTPAPAQIRPARDADWPQIEALLLACRLPVIGAREHLATFLVAEAEGAIVASAGLEREGDSALLRSVAVSPSWRRKGLAAQLLDALQDRARGDGVESLYLLTTSAEAYFGARGFARCTRDDVPTALRGSTQFQGVCPASAAVLRRTL